MADYNINKSNGASVTIPTGAIDNTFDIPLIGQDAINYGDDLATAQLRQLENFANTTAPSFGASRTIGQLWYDTTAGQGLKIWNGSAWELLPLDTNVVHTTGAESIAGVKTFSSSAAFTSGSVPFTVNSTTMVTNLNANLLDGNAWTAFASAAQGLTADAAEVNIGDPPVDGYVYSSTAAGARSWIPPASGTGNVDPIDAGGDTSTTVLLYRELTASGPLQPYIDEGGLTYNAGTNTLATSIFSGTLDGNAATATSATSATTASIASTITLAATASATTYVLLADTATGNQAALTDSAGLPYNASSNTLGAAGVTSYLGIGSSLTALNASNISSGNLALARGGTGVTTATGTGSAFVLHTAPTFVTEITVPNIAGSTVSIEGNNTAQIRTQDNTGLSVSTGASGASGATTGAQVKVNNGQWYDIGLNQMPVFNSNVDDVLEAGHCGTCQIRSGTTSRTLTLAAVGDIDFPVGGITTILDLSTAGTYTITIGASTTLFYNSPGAGAVDTAGGCTIGPGGTCTIWRSQASVYYIWGSEITA